MRNCSVKETLGNQPPVLRIDECLSPASIDSVVIAERDSKNGKYASASPINSVDCLEADQVVLATNSIAFIMLDADLLEQTYMLVVVIVFHVCLKSEQFTTRKCSFYTLMSCKPIDKIYFIGYCF